MKTFDEFVNENFNMQKGDVFQANGKYYLVTKLIPNGFEAEHYTIEGDMVEETETIKVKGVASYVNKNVGSKKVFAMLNKSEFESTKDYSKTPATKEMKEAMGIK